MSHPRLWAAIAALLFARGAVAAPDAAPAPPPEVLASRQQVERWIAAFNGWRGAAYTWTGESADEAALRKETRLLIVPSPVPQLSRRRALDGRAIVVTTGLIAMLDELLLAETAGTGTCFNAYGDLLLQAVILRQDAQRARPAEPQAAWPRFRDRVAAGLAGSIGATYRPASSAEGAGLEKGPCAPLTPAALHEAGARVADATETLAMWLFTQQSLRLARLPPLAPPADRSASGPPGAEPAPPVADQPPEELARLALARTGRPEPSTAGWLRKHMMWFDRGSHPPEAASRHKP